MKKTMYRISLFQRETLTNEMASHAAAFNGGHSQFTIPTLQSIIDSNRAIYPSLYGDYVADVTETKFTLSRREKAGEENKLIPLLEIQEVEVWEGDLIPPTLASHEAE